VYDGCLGTTTKRRSHKSQDTQRTPHFPHYLCTLSEQTSALTGRAQTDPMAKLIDHAIIALLCNTTFSYRHIRYTLNERLSPGGCSRRSFDIQKVHSIRFQSCKEPVEETLRYLHSRKDASLVCDPKDQQGTRRKMSRISVQGGEKEASAKKEASINVETNDRSKSPARS
jgi:hypothetical protein